MLITAASAAPAAANSGAGGLLEVLGGRTPSKDDLHRLEEMAAGMTAQQILAEIKRMTAETGTTPQNGGGERRPATHRLGYSRDDDEDSYCSESFSREPNRGEPRRRRSSHEEEDSRRRRPSYAYDDEYSQDGSKDGDGAWRGEERRPSRSNSVASTGGHPPTPPQQRSAAKGARLSGRGGAKKSKGGAGALRDPDEEEILAVAAREEALFHQFDENNDGVISREEFAKMAAARVEAEARAAAAQKELEEARAAAAAAAAEAAAAAVKVPTPQTFRALGGAGACLSGLPRTPGSGGAPPAARRGSPGAARPAGFSRLLPSTPDLGERAPTARHGGSTTRRSTGPPPSGRQNNRRAPSPVPGGIGGATARGGGVAEGPMEDSPRTAAVKRAKAAAQARRGLPAGAGGPQARY